jgi:hypothetical protein
MGDLFLKQWEYFTDFVFWKKKNSTQKKDAAWMCTAVA